MTFSIIFHFVVLFVNTFSNILKSECLCYRYNVKLMSINEIYYVKIVIEEPKVYGRFVGISTVEIYALGVHTNIKTKNVV